MADLTDAELDRLVERLRDLRPMPWDDDIAIAGEQAAAAITALRARIAELEADVADLERDRNLWMDAQCQGE